MKKASRSKTTKRATRKIRITRPQQKYVVTEGTYIPRKGLLPDPKKILRGVERIDYDDVKPPLNEKNWVTVGGFKWERTGGYLGDWYTDMPVGHWMRKVYPFPGIYKHVDFPDMLVRVMGNEPEYYVVFFKKK